MLKIQYYLRVNGWVNWKKQEKLTDKYVKTIYNRVSSIFTYQLRISTMSIITTMTNKNTYLKIIFLTIFGLAFIAFLTACSTTDRGTEEIETVEAIQDTPLPPGAYPVNQEATTNPSPAPETTISESYPSPTEDTQVVPTEIPVQDPSLGMVKGQVFSIAQDKGMVDTIVRLAEVYRDGGRGAYVLDEAFSPIATTDGEGNFTFYNVAPGEFVVIVGDIYNDYEIINDEENLPVTYNVEAGKTLEMGVLEVMLP